jgi:hypothetical protein
MIHYAFQNLCLINRAIENPDKWTCKHREECPITEYEHCLVDEEGTYEEKVKWLEWVEDLIASASPLRIKYNPFMPRVDPKIFKEI